MRLSYREKESLYRSLAQLLRSGIPFPSAVEKLAATAPGRLRSLLHGFRKAMERKEDIGQAFAGQRGIISQMEVGVVAAVERSGRLDHGFQQLAEYFATLAQARATLIRNSVYPVFVLHFGVIMLGLPMLLTEGLNAYLRDIGGTLLVVYGFALALFFVVVQVREAAATNAAIDRFLRQIPLFGKVRRAFALTRFCMIYNLQLEAGVNVMDGLTRAAQASGSGLIARAVGRALPQIREGNAVGPLLAISGAFPEEMSRAVMVAEETGGLDQELARLSREFQAEAVTRLETATAWLAKFLYIAVVLYLGWRCVSTYLRSVTQISKELDM